MQFYQNQLNFAVFCATTGCGVSFADHLNHPDQMVKSVYRFHFYYAFRRILSELQTKLPNESTFSPFNSRIDMKSFERICNEFNINLKTDFRQKLDRNHGLGTLYYWGVHREYNYDWYPPYTSFSSGTTVHLGSIEQEHKNAWTTFILDTSEGLTKAGIERVNYSIRTYVWCLLGSQAQVRSEILTGFDAQKQYLADLEDSINSTVDLPTSIKKYQNVLRYARSKVDFAVGSGLYMLPSDLRLQIGVIENYNNEILVAGDDQAIGMNSKINSEVTVPLIIQTIHQPIPEEKNNLPPILPTDNHENEKTALVLFLTAAGLVYFYFTKK